jgi:hypothetical protein
MTARVQSSISNVWISVLIIAKSTGSHTVPGKKRGIKLGVACELSLRWLTLSRREGGRALIRELGVKQKTDRRLGNGVCECVCVCVYVTRRTRTEAETDTCSSYGFERKDGPDQ